MSDEIKQYLDPGKKNLVLIYVLYLAGIIAPPLALIGAIFAFINGANSSRIYKSHYVFALKSFLISLIVGLITMILSILMVVNILVIVIIPALYAALFLWITARSIIALQYLLADQPHPNPRTFWIK